MNSSLPVPPWRPAARACPGSASRASSRRGREDVLRAAAPPSAASRLEPKIWPIWKRVVAGAAVERGDRAGVVGEEVVVAAEAVDAQAAVERGVVVDALDVASVGLVARTRRSR